MGERIELDAFRGQPQLKRVKRGSGPRTPRGLSNLAVCSDERVLAKEATPLADPGQRVAPRLISSRDAANCRDLEEQTRVVLSTLTPDEQQVLRMRFGIGESPHGNVKDNPLVGDVREIEAQALRKLRHPGGNPLRSVSRR